ncbi:MAG: hypothetical protein ACJARY_003226 [Candidatus Azotimanducaceae bacterium]|jgi:hypothetical protein
MLLFEVNRELTAKKPILLAATAALTFMTRSSYDFKPSKSYVRLHASEPLEDFCLTLRRKCFPTVSIENHRNTCFCNLLWRLYLSFEPMPMAVPQLIKQRGSYHIKDSCASTTRSRNTAIQITRLLRLTHVALASKEQSSILPTA